MGIYFELKVIVYPECKDGVYVIQTSGDDVVFSAVKCQVIREIVENHSGNYRERITGISLANTVLRKILNKNRLYDDLKYLDIISGNCSKMLKVTTCLTELGQYVNGSLNIQKIDMSYAFNEFAKKSNEILNGIVEVKIDVAPGLYINTDMKRLETFFMALIVVVNGGNAENNIINIFAERIDEKISITISPDSSGTDVKNRTFSEYIEIYDKDETNWNLFIINRFCKAFGGMLLINDNSNEKKSINLRFPFCDNNEEPIKFRTSLKSYQDNKFSKYHIMYSDLLY